MVTKYSANRLKLFIRFPNLVMFQLLLLIILRLTGFLCEGEPSLIQILEDLLNGRDVSCRADVQAQVVLHTCLHDFLEQSRPQKGYSYTTKKTRLDT